MSSFVALLASAYFLFVGALFVFQRNLLYFPDTSPPSPIEDGMPEMHPATLTTDDGLDLLAWYRPAAADKPTLAYFHGNAGHIGYRATKVRPFLDAGFGVLLVSYRGYGGNPGKPHEAGLYADGRAALEFLVADGVSRSRTVLYGESLGGGVCVQLAVEGEDRGFTALVLESPFTSVADVAASHYPFVPARWLVKDRFDSLSKIPLIRAPLLIVHGEGDRTVPIRFARRLFDAASEPKKGLWIPEGDHNDLFDFGLAQAVIGFLDDLPTP